jgi:TatD DNase family protein
LHAHIAVLRWWFMRQQLRSLHCNLRAAVRFSSARQLGTCVMSSKAPPPESLFPFTSDERPTLVDIGANLADDAFAGDAAEVFARAEAAGVRRVLLTGTSVAKSAAACALATQLGRGALFTAGVHPHDASSWSDSTSDELLSLLSHPRCVAVGECGLDFNRNFSTPAEQEAALVAQLELAAVLDKPLFLHCREASERLCALLSAALPRLPAPIVVHCFTGTQEEAARFLALSPLVHLGFTGWLCDEREGRAEALQQVVRSTPLDRLLLETDAPYLVPRSCASTNKLRPRRNEPCLLPHVAQAVAEARGISYEEVARATTANAIRVFRLPDE